jgi:hypothetical protein
MLPMGKFPFHFAFFRLIAGRDCFSQSFKVRSEKLSNQFSLFLPSSLKRVGVQRMGNASDLKPL